MMRPNVLKGYDRIGHYKSITYGLTKDENLCMATATFGDRLARGLFLCLLDHFWT